MANEKEKIEGMDMIPEESAPVAENPMVDAPATEYGPNKTAARARLAERYPDLDLDDEEGLYGAWNDEAAAADADASALADYRAADKTIGTAIGDDPRLAGLFQELIKDSGDKENDSSEKARKTLMYLIDAYGDEFVELINDPGNDEFRKRLADKHAADVAAAAEREKLEREAEGNIDASLDNLDTVCAELGISDDDKDEIFKSFIQLCQDLIVDKVSADVWRMLANGYTHDADVEQASNEGEVRGRNERISEKLAAERPSPLAMTGGGGSKSAVPASREPVRLGGALDEARDSRPWYERE